MEKTVSIKNLKKTVINSIEIIIFIILFLPSSDARKDYPSLYLIIPIIYIFLIFFKRLDRLYLNKNSINFFSLWGIFLIYLSIYGMVRNDHISVMISHVEILVMYFLCIAYTRIQISNIAIANVILNIYIFIRCTDIGFYEPIYQGTAINSNQFALILLSGVLCGIYILTIGNMLLKIVSLISIVLSMYMIFISSSRSVMVSIFISFLIYLYYFFRKKKVLYRVSIKTYIRVLIFLSISVVCLIKYFQDIYTYFFNKWSDISGNLTSGRTELWKYIISNTPFFGSKNSINANNIFFQEWSDIGFLGAILFFLIIVITFIKSYKLLKVSFEIEDIFYFCFMVAYVCVGFFESINTFLGKPINIIFWIIAGRVILKYSYKYKQEKGRLKG